MVLANREPAIDIGHVLLRFDKTGGVGGTSEQQSSETLAGWISYLELHPFNLTELGDAHRVMDRHWFRGGYPDSYLATDTAASVQWCEDFITSYVERTLPQLGITAAWRIR